MIPPDDKDTFLAIDPSLLLFISKRTMNEIDKEEKITALGKVSDALNANEYTRLLHFVLDNKAAGS